MNDFFKNLETKTDESEKKSENGSFWLISADKIFFSEIKGYEKFSRFIGMEFNIRKFSVYDGDKSHDSSIKSEDVVISILPGRYCAAIEGSLAKGVKISSIILKKVMLIQKKVEVIEEKIFKDCILETFSRKGEIVTFSFRYTSFSDTYNEFKNDGTKLGSSVTEIDLIKWKITQK